MIDHFVYLVGWVGREVSMKTHFRWRFRKSRFQRVKMLALFMIASWEKPQSQKLKMVRILIFKIWAISAHTVVNNKNKNQQNAEIRIQAWSSVAETWSKIPSSSTQISAITKKMMDSQSNLNMLITKLNIWNFLAGRDWHNQSYNRSSSSCSRTRFSQCW